jgi:hypothetical protein
MASFPSGVFEEVTAEGINLLEDEPAVIKK